MITNKSELNTAGKVLAFAFPGPEKIAAQPDPASETLRCPDCRELMNIRQGTGSKVWFITHPKSRCIHSGDLSRVEAVTRAEAIAKWQEGE